MKILHIITRLVQGGAQLNTVMCCEAQKKAGHDVILAYGPIYGPEGSLFEQARNAGIELHEVPSMVREVSPKKDREATDQLRELIRQLKPDIVHTHSSKAGVIGRIAAWDCKTPAVIHTVHGLPFHRGNNWLKNRVFIAAEKHAAKRCHKIIGITQAMIDEFNRRRIGRPDQYEVVPSGVDVGAFEMCPEEKTQLREKVRAKYNIEPDAKVIGLVARLDKFKGHDDLINCMPLLRHDHGNVYALFVGEGWYGKTLRDRIGFSSLGANVIFTGMLPENEVREHLAAMDLCVLPSYQEGQGRALVEAMLCDVPIVGYDVGGIPEVCIDGETGRLVKVGKDRKLRKVIDEMLNNPQQATELAVRGHQHMRDHYSAEVMYSKLEQIYTNTLSQNVGA